MVVDNCKECMWFVTYALENLINRSSQMNHYSTRGHCCFNFRFISDNKESYFTFIDLAGSEKFNKQEVNSIGSLECKKINNSLFVLRKVISILSFNSTIITNKEKDMNNDKEILKTKSKEYKD